MSEGNFGSEDRRSTREWIEELTEKLLPIPKTMPESELPALVQEEPDWWYNMTLNLYGPQSLGPKGPKHFAREKSAENIEPYMFPLKDMMKNQPKYEEEKPKPVSVKSRLTDSIFKLKKLQVKDPRATCDKITWTCECTPDSQDNTFSWDKMSSPLFQPCICYKDQIAMPKESAMSIHHVCAPTPEYKSNRFIVDELPDYSVISYGRGLIPSRNPDAQPDDPSTIVHSFLLTGEDGFQVEVSQLGARIVAIRAPDHMGQVEDVIMGFERPKDYLKYADLHWGGVVGRLADRVRGPKPQLNLPGNGHTLLTENEDRDHNMGGIMGFDQEIWDVYVRPPGVLFTLLNRNGAEGFPGDVVTSVAYSVLPANRLVVKMDAMASAPTPLALALPLAFNLAGHGEGEEALRDHVLCVGADKYYTTSKKSGYTKYTGEKNIGGTLYDLRIPRQLDKVLKHVPGKKYDMLLIPSEYKPHDEPRRVAKLTHPKSRRILEVWSDLPTLRVSTSLGLPDAARRLPDPHDLADVCGILDELLEEVPYSAWEVFNWLRDADGSGDRANIYNRPPPVETPPLDKKWSLSAQKPGARWREIPKPTGAGDQWPSRPGLTALPPPLRGPTKLPFTQSTMKILREGGMKVGPANLTGRVDDLRRSRFDAARSTVTKKNYNLKPSNVGTIQEDPRRRNTIIDNTLLVPSATSSIIRQITSSDESSADIPLNLTGSVTQANRPLEVPAVDRIKPAIPKPLPPLHRPSVWGKAYPSAWGTERLRLRGGADGQHNEEAPSVQWQNQDPNAHQYEQQQYDPQQYDPQQYYQQYDPQQYDPQQYDPQQYDPQQYDPQQYDPQQYDPQQYDPQYDPQYQQQYDPQQYYPQQYEQQQQTQQPGTTQWPQKQYPDMWPQPDYSEQWRGSYDDITPTPEPSVDDIEAKLYRRPDPSKALRDSGLGSIAVGSGRRGPRKHMVKAERPSGLGSIMTKEPMQMPEKMVDIDIDTIPAQEAEMPGSPIRLPSIDLMSPDIVLRRKLMESIRPPNKGFEFRMPMKPEKEEVENVIDGLMDSILDRIRTPLRDFRGFNSVEYTNNGAILLQPQLEPLLGNKSNIKELLLRPGKRYSHTVEYVFKVREKKPKPKKHRHMGTTKMELLKEEGMIDHCSAEVSLKSDSSESFQKLHDSCSEKSLISLPSI